VAVEVGLAVGMTVGVGTPHMLSLSKQQQQQQQLTTTVTAAATTKIKATLPLLSLLFLENQAIVTLIDFIHWPTTNRPRPPHRG
jgi:hypothetical protein